jgi:hypothetical protein
MSKKNKALVYIQFAWPSAAIVMVLNSILVAWVGSASQVSAWMSLVPLVSGVVTFMGVAAGGGPLVSDQIKAKAGVLSPPSGDGK